MDTDQQLEWGDLDRAAVDVSRALAMDAVEAAGSGHPGTAMSLAPAAYLLYQRLLRHDPTDPSWPGRDRFVLSCGHTSLTLYVQLFLSGYGLTVEDLAHLRQWGSLTPGHPEHGHTPGVEVTTGPLGQGVGNAVGMAMAARRERGLLDPDAPPGQSPFDHTVWCVCSDGDLQEGVSAEASSLAGHQRLGNLVMLYDDNHISIEGDTQTAFSEDVLLRYEAYGWHTQRVEDGNDVHQLYAALQAGQAETERPSIIAMRTVIGYPAPNLQNSGKAHGAALGADEVRLTKQELGFDPDTNLYAPADVVQHARRVVDCGRAARAQWQEAYDAWAARNPEGKALHERLKTRTLATGWKEALPVFEPDAKGMATRVASGKVLSALRDVLPELWGGSADLAGSNNTTMEGADSFLPVGNPLKDAHPYGRTLHFGIREHGMGAIMNGVALSGGTRVYGGTFLVFSDYMRPPVRLAALMQIPTTYVWTHDSIGLGEDGPTHQPVEHLAALRTIPGLAVVRPADGNETSYAWRGILEHTDGPAGIILSRQNLPTYERGTGAATPEAFGSAEGVLRGAYVLAEASTGTPQVLLVATGSEVQVAVAARELLEADGIATRVVSMPCREWFAEQDDDYREQVLPAAVKARVSVEAGVAAGWRDVVGDAGRSISLEHFGASADAKTLFRELGFTPEHVVAAARESLEAAGSDSPGSVSASSSPTGGTSDR